MSLELNQRFYENSDGLFEAGAIASSSSDKSEFRIDNLERRIAVRIAHELTKRVDSLGSTGASYNNTNFDLLNSLSESDHKSLRREQVVFEALPAHGNYLIKVMLPENEQMKKIGAELGKYSIIATVTTPKDEIREPEAKESARNILQQSYTSLFNRVDFFPSEEQQDLEKQLREVGVPIQPSTKEEQEIFAEQEVADTHRVQKLLRNIGVKDINSGELAELCEIKKWDPITVIDLYLDVMTDKHRKKIEHPEITLKDLVDQTSYVQAAGIRSKQEEQMVPRLKKIGLKKEEVERRYGFYEGDENSRLAFRFASWLASREFMAEEAEALAKRIGMGENMPNPKLFKELIAGVYRVYARFEADRHDNYNLGIEWQKKEYQRGREYYRDMIILSLNIFLGRDISTLRDI